MRTLAIDYGSKRIGIALSDESGKLATPYAVLTSASIESILSIIKKEGVQRIVVGLPLNMDDTLGPAARQTIAWAKQLGAGVIFVDERLSSFAAEQNLIERKRAGEKLTRKKKKQQLDALAAAGFLQAFLDGKLSPLHPD
ncbi:MAG TPA: Holliday junction resolvase RuvX [Tepidisphaeraceae bacterium]|jgi:putative Holliday junction resolvase